MKKSKFTEQQVVLISKEVELGAKVGETCRKHGISDATHYKWKATYGGIKFRNSSNCATCRLNMIRLKKMYAELA